MIFDKSWNVAVLKIVRAMFRSILFHVFIREVVELIMTMVHGFEASLKRHTVIYQILSELVLS